MLVNQAAVTAQNALKANQGALGLALERIATGLRVKNNQDGSGIMRQAQTLRKRFTGMSSAIKNIQTANNSLSVAQEGLSQIQDRLLRLKSVATTALSARGDDLLTFSNEAQMILGSIDSLTNNTRFAGRKLLDGSADFRVKTNAGSFQDIDIRTASLSPDQSSRTFELNITRLAERARVETNYIFGNNGTAATINEPTSLSISGNQGTASLNIGTDVSVQTLVSSINAVSGDTGVYASSYAAFGFELATGAMSLSDIESVSGSFSMQVSTGLGTMTVTGNATGDADGDTINEITAKDLELALNGSGLGRFTVESSLDDTAGTVEFFVRKVGSDNFSLQGTAGAMLSVNASGVAPAGAVLHGEYATGASGLTAGTEFRFNLSYEDSTFSERLRTVEASVIATGGGGTFVTAQDLQDGLNAAAGSIAFSVSVLGNQDGTTNAYGQAPAFRITSVDPDMRAFNIADNGNGDADALGLLSMSGGGKGMGSTAFGAVGLFSLEYGSQQFARMSVSGSNSPTFGALGNGPLSGNLQDYGRDVQVMLDGRRSDGFGLDVFASSPALTLRATLSTAASTDTLTSGLRYLQRASAGDTFENLLGVGVSSASITGVETGTVISEVGSDAVQQGIYDTLSIEVIQFAPESPKTKYGLAIQIGDSNSPFDRYVTRIREISLNTLGGGASKTSGAGRLVHQNEAKGGYLSDLFAGGDADLIKNPLRAMRIIDRAIEQVIEEQTYLGGVQNQVLKRTENALASVSDILQASYRDITATDFVAETVNVQAAQMAITGATFALRQANDLTAGILDLLR
ncbi:MAG: hypothetical protein L3J82_01650 [Planctomycetes bacterium]|nr:hypothetical protein [Planctomycetota bacterium]